MVHLSDAQLSELKGNRLSPMPAVVMSIWENEYPHHPKCTTGINVRVLTDSSDNPLWLTSLPMHFDGVKEVFGNETATWEPRYVPYGGSRSHCLWLQTKAERLCYDAISEIETMGADERLSKAQCLIDEAKRLVSSYVDEDIKNRNTQVHAGK